MENQGEPQCPFLQELSQHLDGTPEDMQLFELISNFCRQPIGSFGWRRAFKD